MSRERVDRLTPRELEILQLIADDVPRRTIATILGISFDTVRTHVGNAQMKTRVKTAAALVALALRGGKIR